MSYANKEVYYYSNVMENKFSKDKIILIVFKKIKPGYSNL